MPALSANTDAEAHSFSRRRAAPTGSQCHSAGLLGWSNILAAGNKAQSFICCRRWYSMQRKFEFSSNLINRSSNLRKKTNLTSLAVIINDGDHEFVKACTPRRQGFIQDFASGGVLGGLPTVYILLLFAVYILSLLLLLLQSKTADLQQNSRPYSTLPVLSNIKTL